MKRNEAHVIELDVRPHLRKKLEPFQLIMDTVKTIGLNDVFVLHATFKPTPLFGVLKIKGLTGKAEQVGKEHWISTFVHKRNKHWLDEDLAALDADPNSESQTVQPEQPGDHESAVKMLDNRGLEPPKPMMRTLAALDALRPGDELRIHNDRVPLFLLEELRELGYPFTIDEQPDGSAKVTITKK